MRNDSLFSNGLGFVGKIGFEDLLQKKQTKKKQSFLLSLPFFPSTNVWTKEEASTNMKDQRLALDFIYK